MSTIVNLGCACLFLGVSICALQTYAFRVHPNGKLVTQTPSVVHDTPLRLLLRCKTHSISLLSIPRLMLSLHHDLQPTGQWPRGPKAP